jgi:hypothetical protein
LPRLAWIPIVMPAMRANTARTPKRSVSTGRG